MGRGFIHTFTGEREEGKEDSRGVASSCDTSPCSSSKLVVIEKAAYKTVSMQQAHSACYRLKAMVSLPDTMKALRRSTCTNTQIHSKRTPAGKFRAFINWSQAAVV